ncbi:hypothetical protein [Occultella gossypii]|uniref:Uncharacterized protein n=1 Tax=Occultella gossypii TaxID=2800820 RepID=A0ABS7S311_9MICO|nr:hypothetical protein [Occultella gossypii]MBZ2194718.1 hypothetical protein [Occultella gossypii]
MSGDQPLPQSAAPTTEPGDLTPELIDTDIWTDEMVARAGIPVVPVPFVTVGGGIGSFVTVDYLRIYGVPAQQIVVLTGLDVPWQSYEYLTRVSQIPRTERLRSDSQSRPDNIWGFPSYALSEAFAAKSLKEFLWPLWNVFTEPILTNYFTPRAGQAFSTMEKEMNRIGYLQSVRKGQVRMVRRRAGGGYYTILTPPAGAAPTKRIAYQSQYVHIAIGYPGLRLLKDLQDYRERYRDPTKVVNAYEPHEQVYDQLRIRPGKVIVRGGGIVASRVLQRLIDDRDKYNLRTEILQVFRTFYTGPHGKNVFNRRPGGHGWAYQGFNYPKSVWGGQLKEKMAKLEGDARAQAYEEMGGTNTPFRKDWLEQLKRGRSQGWYREMQGAFDSLRPGPNGAGVVVAMSTQHGALEEYADFVVDCTGLEADIRESRVLADLLDHSGAGRNPKGRLDVNAQFEVIGTRSRPGRLYASGSSTLGGPFPGVDTFLGLQISAQEIADDLARLGFVKRLGPGRSIAQWWRWARNRPI